MLSLEEQAAIGIVLSVNRRVLAAINHNDRYQKEVADVARKAEKEKEKGKGKKRTEQQRGHDYNDSGQRPISPRTGRDNYNVHRHPECLHMQGPLYDEYRSRRDRSRSPGRGGRDRTTERRRSPSRSRSSCRVEYETRDRRHSRSRSSRLRDHLPLLANDEEESEDSKLKKPKPAFKNEDSKLKKPKPAFKNVGQGKTIVPVDVIDPTPPATSAPQSLTSTTLRCLTRTSSGISNAGKRNSMLVMRERGWGLWSTAGPSKPPKPSKTLTEVEGEDTDKFNGGSGSGSDSESE
ncbi:hypothetical protein B0H14DRAFT_3504162 [Mycena olivaceomarginata]|nr:hypothetical protein B0H14DRAFT_3504162 [Mycena olivaceomarginata]